LPYTWTLVHGALRGSSDITVENKCAHCTCPNRCLAVRVSFVAAESDVSSHCDTWRICALQQQ